MGKRIPIHKKRNKTMCKNHKCIIRLNNAYKMLQERYTNIPNVIGNYQYGFTKGRSVDAVQMVNQKNEENIMSI